MKFTNIVASTKLELLTPLPILHSNERTKKPSVAKI